METREAEPRIEQVLASLSEKHEKENAERDADPDDWFESRLETLPEKARDDVRAYAKALEVAGVEDEKQLLVFVQERIRSYELVYEEQRFTVGEKNEKVLKEAYSKEQFSNWFRESLAGKPKAEDLRKIARLSFDANGLKAVNDLTASHEKGTEYLKRIAEVFAAADSPERKRLEELGMTDVIFTTGGGDEYSLLVRSNEAIAPDALEEAVRLYEDAISRLDVSDLVDFKDRDTRLRYMGLSREQYEKMSADERRELDAKLAEEIPEDFKMRASAAGGATTALDGLVTAMRHPSKPLSEEDGYETAIGKVLGGTWDASDGAAAENKNLFKNELRGSAEEGDRFYSKVLARTSEARVLEDRLNDVVDENFRLTKLQREIDKLDELMESETISFKEYKRLKAELKERYKKPTTGPAG